MFNFSTRKVGGLRLVKIGRLNFSFSVSRAYKPIKGTKAHIEALRQQVTQRGNYGTGNHAATH